MSVQLLQWLGGCFMMRGMCKEMHCLGAVSSGSASPQRAGNCGSVLGVVRALGVLVSEGRVQGPPRGYKEGPHCAAPLQPVPNNHVCEKDNYLCDRYVILVREIADRVTTCSYLCVEVLLCADCPCGLAKATCKDPVLPIPSMSIGHWQQSSEMLLEYWCISVVPSKGPEMMNNQSLYQAVRSRLHFSQVAAWWSRSKGAAPSYITTRVVSFSEDNLRRFRETPSEHTFPLAACGDGNSIKVTVWALPRVEDVPILNCPIHPVSEKEEEGAARALTPTKNIPVPGTSTNPETLVLPTLVDDRLQTPCNEPGKHHCCCEEEDGGPPSPSMRTTGERKRRRSLPRGPDFIPSVTPHTSTAAASVLPSVCELAAREHENKIYLNGGLECTSLNYNETRYSASGPNFLNPDTDTNYGVHQVRCLALPFFSDEQSNTESLHFDTQLNKNRCDIVEASLERTFGSQLSIQEQESNVEKRYKCSFEPPSVTNSGKSSCDNNKPYRCRREKSPKFNKKDCLLRWDKTIAIAENRPILFGNNQQTTSEQSTSFTTASLLGHNSMANINWTTSTISGKETEFGYNKREDKFPLNVPLDTLPILHSKVNFVVNPFGESSPFHESNPGPSTYIYSDPTNFRTSFASLPVHQNLANESSVHKGIKDPSIMDTNDQTESNDLSQLMSKLKFPEETDKTEDDRGILDWISKVPSRVFNVATSNGFTDCKSKNNDSETEERNGVNTVKSKQNCNLELSQREFDEVLAVLRARTPAGRRRTPLRTIKRRDKLEKQTDECISEHKVRTASNMNAADCTIHNNVQNRAVLADRLGLAKFHGNGNGNDQSLTRPEKCEAMENLCKNVRKIVCPSKTIEYQSIEGSSRVCERKSVGRIMDERNQRVEKLEKPGAKPAECFYNVTNKADILLGAILRTSKDPRKGLSDISNGARPRTVLSGENFDNKSFVYIREPEKGKQKTGGVKPFEDDRLLPSSLNKRISQLKQLFKKEQDKTDLETSTPEEYCKECVTSPVQSLNVSKLGASPETKLLLKNSKESRVKRKIDFSNLNESAHLSGDQYQSLAANDGTHLSTNSVYQNPLFRGINYSAQNSPLTKLREQSLPIHNGKTAVEEGQYASRNPIKRSTNLRLQIVHRGTENGCINHKQHYNNSDSAFSSPILDDEQKNYVLPAPQEQENYSDLENNDAPDRGVPSAIEQERFRRSLGNAASMVFHSRTGLPLTSSPAPLRRGSCCFDYDSSLNSVSSKRSALFELNTPPSPGAVSLEEGDREAENTCEGEERTKRRTPSRGLPHSHALLGSFEESALNGRLEPVSTVHGFTAELGASGSFCPKHRKLPVTVFFYTLGDNDKVSTPYLAHINLGKKGYQVPRSGTIQVTLLNPLGTVVKMFVVMYDLSDMPSRSHTFLRQRTLRDKTLRYLIHLRFMSGKSGRIYLHTDIRMIICRKSDVDTASDLGAEPPKELRSFVHGPTNPKFSPRC